MRLAGEGMITLISKELILELSIINHYCHDALFGKDNLIWDKAKGTVLLQIKREMTESPKLAKRLAIFSKYEFPLVVSTILIRNVINMDAVLVDIEDSISSVDFQTDARVIRILGVRGSAIKILVNDLNIEMQDKLDSGSESSIWSFS